MTPFRKSHAIAPAAADVAIILKACFALAVANIVILIATRWINIYITDAAGHGIPTDFVNVYAAGRLALDGLAAQAWDWNVHKKAEVAALGQAFDGYFGWHYPPPFLLAAAPLAHLSYPAAFVVWMTVTLAPYAFMVRALTGHPAGWLLALAFPCALYNASVGQNGFLSAMLIGGALYWLPWRPVLAGICIGLLTYKPQYGLLLPFALLATGRWTAIASAGATAVLLLLVSGLVFGFDTWPAFLHWLPATSEAILTEGRAEFGKMQSLLALVRYLGGGNEIARVLQGAMFVGVLAAVVVMWRARIPYTLKAAALATGALLASPYLYVYDMAVLVIPVALLIRIGFAEGFRAYEIPALGCVIALLLMFPLVIAPVGLLATWIVFGLILLRAGFWRRVTVPAAARLVHGSHADGTARLT